MMIISLVGQKGGGGKSTCCWVLTQAALARSEDTSVLLIETDDQGSTDAFVSAASQAYPDLGDRLFSARAETADELNDLLTKAEEGGISFVFIDTAGKHSDQARDVMSMSDRILIPVKPVLHEYRSQLATMTTYENLKQTFEEEGDELAPCGLLLNNYSPSKRLTKEQAEALGEITDHPRLLSFFLPYKTNYETLGTGRVLLKEREAAAARGDGLEKRRLDSDIAEAATILTAIEGMK